MTHTKTLAYFAQQFKASSILDLGQMIREGRDLAADCATGTYDLVWCPEYIRPPDERHFLASVQSSRARHALMVHDSMSSCISKMTDLGYHLDPRLTRTGRSLARGEGLVTFAEHGLVFTRASHVSNAVDAIVTWCSGKQFCSTPGFKVYVNSLARCGFNGDKLIFTHDMELEDRELVADKGFKVIDVDPSNTPWIIRDRHLAWYSYLIQQDYRYLGFLDCKDIFFQRDPIKFLESHPRYKVFLVQEGKRHSQCAWNTDDQDKLQMQTKQFVLDFKDWEVICAGTIFGYAKSVLPLMAQLWSITLVNRYATDQGVLNYLYHVVYKRDPDYFVASPYLHSLAANADLPHDWRPQFKDGRLYMRDSNEPYHIYHQYDRVDGVRDAIFEAYKS